MNKFLEKILTESRNDILVPLFDKVLEEKIEDKFTHVDLDHLFYEYQILVEQRLSE
ncbi:hypothetical protein MHB65_20025 [Lysinibacillus sp. FSL K6-0075]|uniref:hypothetical protein n=1 Tax=Lysinibacillus sp. FSL K6-0075 TaxID=2921415 RepID=UPI00315921CA